MSDVAGRVEPHPAERHLLVTARVQRAETATRPFSQD
jgi:hypothetical protein